MILPCGRQDQAGQGAPPRITAQTVEHVEPGEPRHHQVEHHRANPRVRLERREGLLSVVDERDPERPLGELGLDDATDVRFVVGDEDLNRRLGRGRRHAGGVGGREGDRGKEGGGEGEVKPIPLSSAGGRDYLSRMSLSSLRRATRLLAVLGFAGAVTACDDPFQLQARLPNFDRAFEVWAISGSPATLPSALVVPTATVSRLDVSGSFDIAFDIDADGRVVVLPVSRVVQPITGTRGVALQRLSGVYNTILEVPSNGWVDDSTLVVSPGESFGVRSTSLYCQFELRQQVYAKLFVESADPVTRKIVLLARINPNCGFRSLADGVPEF